MSSSPVMIQWAGFYPKSHLSLRLWIGLFWYTWLLYCHRFKNFLEASKDIFNTLEGLSIYLIYIHMYSSTRIGCLLTSFRVIRLFDSSFISRFTLTKSLRSKRYSSFYISISAVHQTCNVFDFQFNILVIRQHNINFG